jgi:uncharacterized protein (TIGR02996 family)
MTDHDALLAAVIAHPDDDTPRLVMADWFQENGQETRAEFIRVQCELAKTICSPLCFLPAQFSRCVCERANHLIRNEELFVKWAKGAVMPLWGYGSYSPTLVDSWDHDNPLLCFSRGFVSAVTCSGSDWATHGDAVCAAHPVRRVRVIGDRWDCLGTIPTGETTRHGRMWVAGKSIQIPRGDDIDSLDGTHLALRRILSARWPSIPPDGWEFAAAATPPQFPDDFEYQELFSIHPSQR